MNSERLGFGRSTPRFRILLQAEDSGSADEVGLRVTTMAVNSQAPTTTQNDRQRGGGSAAVRTAWQPRPRSRQRWQSKGLPVKPSRWLVLGTEEESGSQQWKGAITTMACQERSELHSIWRMNGRRWSRRIRSCDNRRSPNFPYRIIAVYLIRTATSCQENAPIHGSGGRQRTNLVKPRIEQESRP